MLGEKPATGGDPGKAQRRWERKPGNLPPPEHRHSFRGMEPLVRGRPRAPVPLLTALAVLLAVVLAAAGCEHRARPAPAASAPGADLVATADYGAHELLSTRVAPGTSVMRALRGATDVRTTYSGGFVQSMLGRSSDPVRPARLVLLRRRDRVVGGRQGRAGARRRRNLVGPPGLECAARGTGGRRPVARAARATGRRRGRGRPAPARRARRGRRAPDRRRLPVAARASAPATRWPGATPPGAAPWPTRTPPASRSRSSTAA